MNYEAYLKEANEAYLLTRASFTKEDIATYSDKGTLRGRMRGFLTSEYYKRGKLLLQGELYYGYAFKSWDDDKNMESPTYPCWILFSPSLSVRYNPEKLIEATKKLQSLELEKPTNKEMKKLKGLITEPLSEASFYVLPEEIAGKDLIYLSIIYVKRSMNPSFHLGLNIIIANQSISKEVLLLPERLMSPKDHEAYLAGSLFE